MKCSKKTEVFSRVTGYFRPVQYWNDGKQEEFSKRKSFDYSLSQNKSKNIHNSPDILKEYFIY